MTPNMADLQSKLPLAELWALPISAISTPNNTRKTLLHNGNGNENRHIQYQMEKRSEKWKRSQRAADFISDFPFIWHWASLHLWEFWRFFFICSCDKESVCIASTSTEFHKYLYCVSNCNHSSVSTSDKRAGLLTIRWNSQKPFADWHGKKENHRANIFLCKFFWVTPAAAAAILSCFFSGGELATNLFSLFSSFSTSSSRRRMALNFIFILSPFHIAQKAFFSRPLMRAIEKGLILLVMEEFVWERNVASLLNGGKLGPVE